MVRFSIIFCFLILCLDLFAQCTVSIQASDNTIYCDGDAVTLTATGAGTGNVVFFDDFNTQSTNPNWVNTPTGIYNSTCVSPQDGTPFFWINYSGSPREFKTPPLNLSNGGRVTFFLKLADKIDEDAFSGFTGCNRIGCTEPVYFQYNESSNPSNWVDLFSVVNGDNFRCAYNNGSFPWEFVDTIVPLDAQWNGVQFRVVQFLDASANPLIVNSLDNWGIDDFKVEAFDPFYYDWNHLTTTIPPGDANSVNVIPTATTNYQVTYTNNAGISCQDNVTITYAPLSFTVNSLVHDTCTNSKGEFNIAVSGGVPPYEYSIDNGSSWVSSSNFSGLSFGSYDVLVRDNASCSTNVQVVDILNYPDPVITNVSSQGPDCYNAATGYIEFFATTSSPTNLNYSIDGGSNFQTSSLFNSLSSGSYDLIVEDDNGCQKSWVNITFSNPPEIILDSITTDIPLCFDSCNGQINIYANGGSGNLYYSIDGGNAFVSIDTFPDQCPGLFNIVVQDDSGCVVNANNQLLEPTDIQTTINITHPGCLGSNDGEVDFQVTGGTPGYTYTWNGSPITSSPITNLFPGTYWLVVIDDNNCLDSNEVTLTNQFNTPAPVISNVVTTNPKCFQGNDGEVEIIATGNAVPFTFELEDLSNSQLFTQVNDNIFDILSSGSYSIVVIDVNQCESAATTVQLQDPNQLFIVSQVNPATCSYTNDGGIDLSGSNGGTGALEYRTGSSNYQTSPVFNNLLAGSYNLYVRDANNCVDSTIGTYLPPYPIDIQVTVTSPTCIGDTNGQIVLNVTGGTSPYTMTWDSPPNTGTNPSLGPVPWGTNPNYITNNIIDTLAARNDTIWVMDANECRDSLSVTILEPNSAKIDAITVTDVLCHNDSNATIQVFLPNTDTFYIENNLFSDTFSLFQYDTTIIDLFPTTGWVKTYDQIGCRDSIAYTINNPPPLTLNSFNDTTLCIGSSISYLLTPTGGTPYSGNSYDYFWNGTQQANPFQITPNDSITYDYFVADGNNCRSDTLSFHLDLFPELSLSLSHYNVDLCFGDSIQVESFVAGGSGSGYIYNWSNNLNSDSIQMLSPSQTTTYDLTVNDDCTTPAVTVSVTVNVNLIPTANFTVSPNEGCYPVEVLINQIGLDTNLNVNWNLGDGTNSTDMDNITHVYNNAGNYTVQLTLTDSSNCSDSHTETVEVYNHPVADFTFDPQTPTIINNAVDFVDASSSDVTSYHWVIEYANGLYTEEFSESFEPILFNITEMDTFQTCLFVETQIDGCADTICYDIPVRDIFYIYAPNAFTPDNDGINDVFLPVIHGYDAEKFRMFIYDRWGNKIFESINLNTGWNGLNKNNELCQSGVYVYRIILEEKIDESNRAYVGNITLIR